MVIVGRDMVNLHEMPGQSLNLIKTSFSLLSRGGGGLMGDI